MKKIRVLILFVCIGSILAGGLVSGLSFREDNNIHHMEISINTNSFSFVNTEKGEKIIAEGFGRLNHPGEPYLPSKIIAITLPPNSEFIDLSYAYGPEIYVDDYLEISPITPADLSPTYPEIVVENNKEFASIYESIYSSNSFYPKEIVTFIGCSAYRSYSLLDIQISPFVYNPQLKIVKYYPNITLTISYRNLGNLFEDDTFAISHQNDSRAQNIIYNYEEARQWYTPSMQSASETYDFVIITLDHLLDSIESLVQWEEQKGRSVNVVTLSWIQDNYQGIDTEQQIRNFLRDMYPENKWGIRDVCIIGHWNDIPMRKTAQHFGSSNPVETDFYYAELSLSDSESWDADEDQQYGDNTDPIDYYAEITVGRIPWSEVETVRHICEKSVVYEQNHDPSFKNNVLLCANFVDQYTDGAVFMEYFVNETLHPWMDSWMKTRLYERDSTYSYDYVLNHMNMVNIWSQGKYGIVSWHAHGNPFGSGGFISVDDCQYLNDEFPAIISAASCSNSDTDHENIGQCMLRQGAVGFLGANKVAYYRSRWDEPTDGSDQSLKYFFLTSITSGDYTQGEAHQYGISQMFQQGLWDSLKYETFCHGSLWGNPDISISSASVNTPPSTPEPPSGQTSGSIRESQYFRTYSTDLDQDPLYYCWDWDDGEIEWTGPFPSGEEINISHSWTSEGTYQIKVKARDEKGSESEWSDPLEIIMPRNKIAHYSKSEQYTLDPSNIIFFMAFPIEFNEYETNVTFFCPGRGIGIWMNQDGIKVRAICGASMKKNDYIGIANPTIVLCLKI